MSKNVFSPDVPTTKELKYAQKLPIEKWTKIIPAVKEGEEWEKGKAFAKEITQRFFADFEKPGDKMAHVSTFIVVEDTVYVTYYANTKEPSEDPKNQTARLAYAKLENPNEVTVLDLQTTGDTVDGKLVDMVYDTILMQKDENTLYVLWTACVEENYYRFYCPFDTQTKTLGEVDVNRLKIGDVVNDFSATGIRAALAENGLPCKEMYSDIGIMQKLSSRVENGEAYYYTGAYSGDLTFIIKSKDLVTWEYVAQPDFVNQSQWENATYVIGDQCYYFVRQHVESPYGFLTVYDLEKKTWETPVLVEDSQSRGDFIEYDGGLYLIHAPHDREHLGLLKIDKEDLAGTKVVLQGKMDTSCFYPFMQYFRGGELALSYTIARQNIRLAEFTLSKYL